MTKPITCKYCNSTDIPDDLVCVRMCDVCCTQGINTLFDGLGLIRSALLRRHTRKWRYLRSDYS
jgi:hypothetical protein